MPAQGQHLGQAKEWKSDSVDGALLFILFHERVFHPNSFSSAEIFEHPDLNPILQGYSKRKFPTYCTTAANRCIKFERTGTGLSRVFKEFIQDARGEYSDLIKKLKEDGQNNVLEEEDDEDDESYRDEEEEDVSLHPDFDEESQPLSDRIQNPNLDVTSNRMPSRAVRSTTATVKGSSARNTSTTPIVQQSQPTLMTRLHDPYVLAYPSNDKVFFHIPMDGNVDEDDDFKIEVKPKRVQAWVRIPSELEDAYELLGEDGRLSDNRENCPHCILFQAAIDKRINETVIKRDDKGHLWMLKHDLPIPFEVMLKYYDKEGVESDGFMIQTNGLGFYYAQFWLKAVPIHKAQANRAKGMRVGKAKKAEECKDEMSISSWTEETVTVQGCDVKEVEVKDKNKVYNRDKEDDEKKEPETCEGVRSPTNYYDAVVSPSAVNQQDGFFQDRENIPVVDDDGYYEETEDSRCKKIQALDGTGWRCTSYEQEGDSGDEQASDG